MVLMGPFQPEIFYHSMKDENLVTTKSILYKKPAAVMS